MENALVALAGDLARTMRVTIIALSGPELTSPELIDVECVHLRVPPGITRLPRSTLPLRRALQRLPQGTVVVAVGVWCTTVLSWVRHWDMTGCIVWEHSLTPQRIHISRRMRLLWLLARPAFRRADTVVCVSDAVRRQCARARHRTPTTVVIPNLLPAGTRPSPASRNTSGTAGPYTLLGLGVLAPVKNWRLAVEAMEHLPRCTLRLAGDGPEHKKLLALVAARRLEDRVQLLGRRSDVAALLEECDVLVHPSHSETFGYALFEAAAAGVPVAVCDRAVMNELVPYYVPGVIGQNEPRDFADAVESALSLARSPTVWEEAAKRRERTFGPHRVRQQWQHVLHGAWSQRVGDQ
ncbi:glycosyltransferase [Knoellia sp. p5-6-4]|uniref:glycosyltransferase n=1 Tax=unclassified Knoellia TaxID=2618719 RepID=UPI0023DCB9E9|nr:glycosyltransferase [Knoellia sp. p5-6-4]MDF2144472.1 glycosyltransferase [Knoellia sp. p5-6-4]